MAAASHAAAARQSSRCSDSVLMLESQPRTVRPVARGRRPDSQKETWEVLSIGYMIGNFSFFIDRAAHANKK
ncbi:MAG: hypothetical protein R3A10_06790 [Caldilineaceae bacterium]